MKIWYLSHCQARKAKCADSPDHLLFKYTEYDVDKDSDQIIYLKPCLICQYVHLLVSTADNFLQTVWTQVRPDKTSGLTWFQSV